MGEFEPFSCLARLLNNSLCLECLPTSPVSFRTTQTYHLVSLSWLLSSIGSVCLLSHQNPWRHSTFLTQRSLLWTCRWNTQSLPSTHLCAVASENHIQAHIQCRHLVGNVQTNASQGFWGRAASTREAHERLSGGRKALSQLCRKS